MLEPWTMECSRCRRAWEYLAESPTDVEAVCLLAGWRLGPPGLGDASRDLCPECLARERAENPIPLVLLNLQRP